MCRGGATVLNSRRRATTPIDRAQLGHLLAQHAAKASNEIIETGIKVIDVMCPIRSGGSVAIAGGYGAGLTVMMAELVRRISKGHHPLTIFVLFPPPSEIWPPSLDENFSIADTLKKENGDEGTAGLVQTFFLGGELAWTAENLAVLDPVDTVIHLSRELAQRKNYPPVDVLTTRSRLLEDDRVAAADIDLARRIRELITHAAPPKQTLHWRSTRCCRNGRKSCRHFSRSRSLSPSRTQAPRLYRQPRQRACDMS